MNKDEPAKELAEIINSARPGKPIWKWIIVLVVVALAGGGLAYYKNHAEQESGPIYTTEELTRGDLSLSVTATGNLEPTNQVTVGSELSGTIAEIYVDTNDRVKKDQPIAKLDATKLTQQTERSRAILLAANARISQASATLAEANASLGRSEELHRLSKGQTPSKAAMDAAVAAVERAKADLESAKASVAQSEADLKAIERDLSKTIIRSPVDGIVLTRSVEVGQTVAASFTAPILFLIAEDLRKMQLVIAIAEADIGRLESGQSATFTVDAWPSRTYAAEVKRVSFGSIILNNVVTYNTELEVANDDLSLRPGMTATADVSVAKSENVLLIPNAALRYDPAVVEALTNAEKPKRTLVQSLAPGRRWSQGAATPKPSSRPKTPRFWTLVDGQPVEVPVTTGLTDGRLTEVTGENLSEGMPIIVSARPPIKS